MCKQGGFQKNKKMMSKTNAFRVFRQLPAKMGLKTLCLCGSPEGSVEMG